MKKILAVSLCAIMAVSAARADIASVEYVEKQTGTLSSLTTTAKGNLVGAINELNTAVGTKAAQADLASLQGTVSTLTGTVSTNKEAADKTQDDLEVLEATVAGLTTGDTAAVSNATFDAFKEANTQAIATAKSEAVAAAKTETTSQIAALDSSAVAADGSVLTGVTITDGKITAKTEKALGTLASKSEVAKTDLAATVQTSLGLADSALQKADITTGTGNGTISVDGADVAVKGLGTAAYTASTQYATSAQGAKADTAVQPSAISDMQTKTNMKNAITDDMDKENTYPTVALLEAQIDSSAQETGQEIADINSTLAGKQDTISDLATIRSGAKAGTTALQKADITTGTSNGTIAVDGEDVAVKGLGTAAYTAADAYATSAQGAKADTAMQESALKGLASWSSAKCGTTGVTCSLVSKDGTIAWEAVKY